MCVVLFVGLHHVQHLKHKSSFSQDQITNTNYDVDALCFRRLFTGKRKCWM